MVNKVKVKATCYVVAYDKEMYTQIIRNLDESEQDFEWFKPSNAGYEDDDILSGIAGGNGNLIMIHYALPITNSNKGGIDAVSVEGNDKYRDFDFAAIAEFGLIFKTRDNAPFSEEEKVILKIFGYRILTRRAIKIGSLFAEFEASDGSSTECFFNDSAVETCDPLKNS